MSEKVLITSDSTTDLGEELLKKYNIPVLGLTIILNDKNYTDGVDVTPEKIYENYRKNKTLPKTAAPNPEQCIEFFEPYIKQGYHIVHFVISSEMSSSCQNTLIAAQELGNVHVVDTRNLSSGGGLLVLTACELAEQGKSAAEIAQYCRDLAPNVDASFVIDSLEFLYKGGRCSSLAMLGANLMSFKPCIVVKDGKMSVGKKYRGKFDAVLQKYIADRIGDASDIYTDKIFITHGGAEDRVVQACYEKVKSYGVFENIYITHASCTVCSHCGANTLGVLFIRKHAI